MPEADFYRWLSKRSGDHPAIRHGIGDDAAVLDLANGGDTVITSDLIAETTHFAEATDPRLVGRKALAVNLSDLAAMGARPVAAVVSILLRRETANTVAAALMEGLMDFAQAQSVAIVGGDTNTWEGPLVVSVTAIGAMQNRSPMQRSAACPGDAICVTGTLGGSALERHLTFEPRTAEGISLCQDYGVRTAMDVSDGLAIDLSRMMSASGCAAELDLTTIPISADARTLSESSGKCALEHAMQDGEDFELLFTIAASEAATLIDEWSQSTPLTKIGICVEGEGVWSRDEAKRVRIEPRGYEHL